MQAAAAYSESVLLWRVCKLLAKNPSNAPAVIEIGLQSRAGGIRGIFARSLQTRHKAQTQNKRQPACIVRRENSQITY